MAYVVIVFCMFNTAALAGGAYILWSMYRDIPVMVQTAIQDEIRRQDDRIEKRQAKAEGAARESDGNAGPGFRERMLPGRPYKTIDRRGSQ